MFELMPADRLMTMMTKYTKKTQIGYIVNSKKFQYVPLANDSVTRGSDSLNSQHPHSLLLYHKSAAFLGLGIRNKKAFHLPSSFLFRCIFLALFRVTM